MKELTKAQKRILDFLETYAGEHGRPPTVREIGRAFGIRSPNGVAVHLAALERKGYIRRRAGIARGLEFTRRRRSVLPVAGMIAAGQPVEAVEQKDESLDVADLFRRGNWYVLRVKGESMVDECIQDGDYVVVEPRKSARNGEIVVALVNGEEATLKRFFREKDRIRLEPANARMRPIYVRDVEVQGVVKGVVRKY
jgi:repressor LexA